MQLRFLSEYELAQLPSTTGTPEDLLIAAEDGPEPEQEPGILSAEVIRMLRLAQVFERVTSTDRLLLALIFLAGWTQREAGAVVGLTQAGVSYRVSRALERLKLFAAIPAFTHKDFDRDLAGVLAQPELAAIKAYWVTTNQTKAGALLGLTQWQARVLIVRAIKAMRAQELHRYAEAFEAIMRSGSH